jgi:hypothetical protein
MPFIRGRYHINPLAGQALETAREAEEALAALQRDQSNSDATDPTTESSIGNDKGPIHRVEIEAAEVVPSHAGRGQRGFVARVHRAPSADAQDASSGFGSPSQTSVPVLQKPEMHAFSSHGDLVDFLQNEFAKDCGK